MVAKGVVVVPATAEETAEATVVAAVVLAGAAVLLVLAF